MLALSNPFLPNEAEEVLSRHGYSVLRLPPHPALSPPVAAHPDLLLFFAGNAVYCTKSYFHIAKDSLELISHYLKKPIRTIAAEYGNHYPLDVPLNALYYGSHFFCNPKTVAPELLRMYTTRLCVVHQGYTKCSVLPVGQNALITSDSSIANAAKNDSYDVLLLPAGGISLPGYDYGFIGGCAGYAPYGGCDTIFFCGDLSLYPYAEDVTKFCTSHGCNIQSLGHFPPLDVGTIFLI